MSEVAGSHLNLTIHHLKFTLEAKTLVHLGPQAGAQIRGALWQALQAFACSDQAARGQPGHSQNCPMCRLMALESAVDVRGINPARPFAIQPPLAERPEQDRFYQAGETFTFGIRLFGESAEVFPYICQAVYRMGNTGIGYGRGQFTLLRVQAVNSLTGETQELLQDRQIIATPGLPVTDEVIAQAAQRLPHDAISLRFLTPTQLTGDQGRLSSRPDFDTLIARLLERCQSLELHYTAQPSPQPIWRERHLRLTDLAKRIRIAHDHTRWIKVRSGSRRTGGNAPISGFVGDAFYEGELSTFREWLLWGQMLHIGKNAVKGSGWYRILVSGS